MPRFRLGLIVAWLACTPATVAFAQAPALAGQRDVFAVSDCAAAIPLRFVLDRKPLAVRTSAITPRPASTPPSWTIEWDRPAPSQADIDEYVSLGHLKEGCPVPGLYSVPLTVFADDKSTLALAITLVRVAEPVLDIPTAVTLAAERVWDAPEPAALVIRQTAPGAPDVRLSLAAGELKTAAGESTGIMLEPEVTPLIVRAGESERLLLTPSATPAPGVYTTRLVLSSPALKTPATIEIAYRVRFTTLYLIAIVLAGIALGWFVNVYLASRAALQAALHNALRSMQAISRRAAPQRDPAVQQRLLAVANLLQSSLDEASTPDEANALVNAADSQAKDIETKAVEAVANLQQSLAATRSLFRAGGQALDPMLAARLAAPIAEFDALQRAADAGDVEQTMARLQDFNRDLPERILPAVQDFLADLRTDLDALGPLPDGKELRGTRDQLRQQIGAIYGAVDLGLLVKAADELARQVRGWMDLVAPASTSALWRDAARMVGAGKPQLAQRLGFLADQAEQLRRTATDPMARLTTLAGLGKSMGNALAEAGAADPAVGDALAQGDLLGAARRLGGQPTPERMAAQALVERTAPAAGLVLALPPSGPVAVLRVKPLIPLGQDSMVTVRWMIDPPSPQRTVWRSYPADAAAVQGVAAGAMVRPKLAGFVTILLELDGARIAEIRTFAGEITEQARYVADGRKGALARALTTAAAALLTAFAGYQVFAPTWFGTVGDFSGAFLWGFFGQFGLDRVRELARPALGKTLPN